MVKRHRGISLTRVHRIIAGKRLEPLVFTARATALHISQKTDVRIEIQPMPSTLIWWILMKFSVCQTWSSGKSLETWGNIETENATSFNLHYSHPYINRVFDLKWQKYVYLEIFVMPEDIWTTWTSHINLWYFPRAFLGWK